MKNNKLEDSLFVTEESMWEKFAFPFVWVWSSVKEKIDIRRYRRQRGKYGYATYDLWDIRDWFVRTLKPMLKEISSNIVSYPPELSQEEWSDILSEMAELLDVFDFWDYTVARCRAGVNLEDNSDNAYLLIKAEQDKAKERFFFLFNKWFYHLEI